MQSHVSITPAFLLGTLNQGGAERQLYYMLQTLCHAGCAPRLFSFDPTGFWGEPIRALGVKHTCVGQSRARLARLFRLVRELQKDPPDVIQSQHCYTNLYASLAGRIISRPAIGALRSDGRSEELESGGLLGRQQLRLPDVLAINSEAALDYARGRGVPVDKLFFLPNVVDTEWFHPVAHPQQSPTILLTAGRMVPPKRFDRFLSILARLKRRANSLFKGIIIGPEDPSCALRPQLEAQAQALQLLPDYLEFRGSIADMRPVYRSADIFVLTSDYEGTPNVVLEAMACGLPVVATRVGDVPRILQQAQTGFLSDATDEEEMTNALLALLEQPDLRRQTGERARAHIEAHYALDRLPMYLGSLYERALGIESPTGHWPRGRYSPRQPPFGPASAQCVNRSQTNQPSNPP